MLAWTALIFICSTEMTMLVYRRYQCDLGHEWVVQRKQGQPEEPGDVECPEGHEAITCNEEEPADVVQILIRPAARIVDKIKNQIALEGRYWVVLLDRSGLELCSSMEHYSWEEAVALATLFRGKDTERAMQWWRRKSP